MTSLQIGLRDGDTIQDLWRRLNEVPFTLEELFQKILGDLNPEYFTQGCEMFQLVVTALGGLTLLDMSLALDGCESAILAPISPMTMEEMSFRVDTMRRRVVSRSKGLLEIYEVKRKQEEARITYLHRTVKDFFKNE